MGLVPQKAFLFSGSVARNLRFGDQDATDAELWTALEIAQARDFVASMDGGLEAEIGQGGSTVSGGQRQRLAIARALVKKPSIFLFDDSFSALDARTDQRLRAALRDHTRHATVVIVAQRVGTVMHADRIVVMDGGQIVGVGTHTELLASNETYQEIVASQLTREDAA
jgi:ATP-binding cassette subfamily B protein